MCLAGKKGLVCEAHPQCSTLVVSFYPSHVLLICFLRVPEGWVFLACNMSRKPSSWMLHDECTGSDYGMLTILKTSKVGGLQIHLDGTWIDVEAVDGFIVNIGELLYILTSNGHHIQSSTHQENIQWDLPLRQVQSVYTNISSQRSLP